MVLRLRIALAAISHHLLWSLLAIALSFAVIDFARSDQDHSLGADQVNENVRQKLYEGYLDVDNDKRTSALTDGLQILRYLFGFKGDSLTFGVVPPSAERTDAAEIEESRSARPMPPECALCYSKSQLSVRTCIRTVELYSCTE